MPSLWLAQLLCPQRHALCGLIYDVEQTPVAEIEAALRSVLDPTAEIHMDPKCGLCHATELHIEHGKLKTDDWDTEVAKGKSLEARQILSRALADLDKRGMD